MNELDKKIIDKEKELEYLKLLKTIQGTGNCNICMKRKVCEYNPGFGKLVRYNCAHFQKMS